MNLCFASSWRRRRLQSGQEPCGIEAIIAACNEAFGVETCECVQHSDGGCPVPVPDIVETAGNGTETGIDTTASDAPTDAPSSWEQTERESGTAVEAGTINDSGDVEVSSGTAPPSASPESNEREEELVAAELGADGRLLQENRQAITTDLEIKFITDVEVRAER